MAKITTLFIDKGGVLVDNDSVGAQFRRLLGEFLPTALGGRPDAWATANVGAHERAFERYREASRTDPSSSIGQWFANDARLWLYDMCDQVGVAHPVGTEADRIASDAFGYVLERVEIQIPRAVARLRELRHVGLTLHTASGDSHADVAGYLGTLGVQDVFDRVYGTDLVNVWKSGPAFYRALLADVGTPAEGALVIDDSERAIEWAAACGLQGVLVRRRAGEKHEDAVLRALDEVETYLRRS